jgi:hypothetical protein
MSNTIFFLENTEWKAGIDGEQRNLVKGPYSFFICTKKQKYKWKFRNLQMKCQILFYF